MEVAATAEQRQKMKQDKTTEKRRKREDKEKLNKLQKQDKQDKKKIGQTEDANARKPSVLIGAMNTNPMSIADNQLRTRTGSSPQKVEI
jgi:hypothetical protein